MATYDNAQRFVLRHARPLDAARWRNSLEDGERAQVLEALAAYQNADGGFGHAIEADYWNPASTPIGTWAATEILHEVKLEQPWHPLIDGILRYLDSGDAFDTAHRQWMNTVLSNNEHPHAQWWGWSGESRYEYNPTAALAGFAVRFAQPESLLYQKAEGIVREAYDWFAAKVPFEEMHVTKCFIRLYEYLEEADSELVDLDAFRALLMRQVDANICRDETRWFTEYVARPSVFITGPMSMFYRLCPDLVERECSLLQAQQQPDGAWPVTWRWGTAYPREEALSLSWWQAVIALENVTYLKAFGKV